jgi:cytochrome c553
MTGRLLRALTISVALALIIVSLSSTPSLRAQDVDVSETVELCTGCHGDAGLPVDSDTPIIWGQEFYYLYVQLKDYKAGRRANEIMQDIVADLDKKQMQALAQYFSEQPWPNSEFVTPEESKPAAQNALSAGQCVQCHLGGFEGNSRIPRLAEQQADYLERTMLEFKQKIRLNSPAKNSLLGAYDDKDIAAMAHYLAGF